jgi:hypothetical protein
VTATAGKAAEIEAALADVSATLESGDLEASARASVRLVAACKAAEGTQLDRSSLERLQQLLQRCQGLAARTEGTLSSSLQGLANGTRANRAYRDE